MTERRKKDKKSVVLIVCNYYLPGYKAGGGLRTLVNTVERFKDKFDFRIINFGHDGDGKPYDSVEINSWNEVDGAKVFYLPPSSVKLSKLRELISEVSPNLIYLNSVFSKLTIYLLTLRKLQLIPQTPVILAPEGELSDGALQLKAGKKKTFIRLAKSVGLYKNLIWKVTAEPEKVETERFKGSVGEVFIAPNLPAKSIFDEYRQELKPKKERGRAKMIFLSRYARKKNFKWLIENLEEIEGELTIDVYGPLEDTTYWRETEAAMRGLPSNVKVDYKGQVKYEEVFERLFSYQFFILPTLGENFGHVFIEALAAGCPLITSDRTPWTNLQEKRIGWDLPLEEPRRWTRIINECISLDAASYSEMSDGARTFACRWLADPRIEESTLNVLRRGLEKGFTKAG